MTYRDYLDGVVGRLLEPLEMPERPVSRPCPARGCDGGVIYAGRATCEVGDAIGLGNEEWDTCSRCGGLGEVST